MASSMAGSVINGLVSGAKAHSSSIGNTAIFIVVLAGEIVIGNNLFSCPCLKDDTAGVIDPDSYSPPTARQYYGISFFVWPAVVGFCIAVLVNKETHRCLSASKRHCNCRRHLTGLGYLCRTSAWCFTAPTAWLILVFIDGRYLECVLAKVPTHCLPEVMTLVNTTASVQENELLLKTENAQHVALSQVIAWTILGIGALLAVLGVLCTQLFSSTTYYQLHFMNTFRQKEMESFHSVSQELLDEWLKKKWKRFFHQAREGDWESISELPRSSPNLEENTYFYSAFHEWEPQKMFHEVTHAQHYNVVNLKPMGNPSFLADETDQKGPQTAPVIKGVSMPLVLSKPPAKTVVDEPDLTILDRPSEGNQKRGVTESSQRLGTGFHGSPTVKDRGKQHYALPPLAGDANGRPRSSSLVPPVSSAAVHTIDAKPNRINREEKWATKPSVVVSSSSGDSSDDCRSSSGS